ncbi:MAG TPA: hypothetical protein VGR57_19750 [Ktedonobacterales bacterium]|nr:hypothetical protein [Ktedonobacterales bacterium]
MSGSRTGFYVGLAMLCAGVGLTVASALFSTAMGLPIYFVFYGLILFGIVRMAISVPSLFFGDGDSPSRRRLGPRLAQAYVAPPNEMPLGRCWMCGGTVKPGNVICLHCGAAQPPSAREESEMSRLSGYDPTAGQLVTFLPSEAPDAANPYPSAPHQAVTPGSYPYQQPASQWNTPMGPPPGAPGGVWRPEPGSEGDWDEAPAKRPRWRLR